MKLYEYEAKEIFRNNGIPVQDSCLIESPEDGIDFFSGNRPVVLKAQVLSGGRGKSGGIRFASEEREYRDIAEEMLKSSVKGLPVNKLIIEERINISKELYLGFAVNRSQAKIILMMSDEGGMDIEELASLRPQAVRRLCVDILDGIDEKELDGIILTMDLSERMSGLLKSVAMSLYDVFVSYECEVAEINPLVITDDDRMLAVDARMAIYDEAIHKNPQYNKEEDTYTELEKRARKNGLGYVEIDGNIGVIGNGAGLNMATLDILRYFGGRPSNFLEVSGRTYHKAREAIEIILSRPGIKVIFGNFFGCISRCDVIASGLAEAVKSGIVNVPMVIAMRGTGAEEGIRTLKAAGISEIYEDDIDAGRRVAEILGEI
jgi:succinyl-CoA synthetase beta subunit